MANKKALEMLKSGDIAAFNKWVKERRKKGKNGVDLDDQNLSGLEVRKADLRDAYLNGANLRHARLRQADLRGANLREANLTDADLRRAKCKGAVMKMAKLDGARGL